MLYIMSDMRCHHSIFFFFFFNDTATTEIYTLSLHDALPIFARFFARNSNLPAELADHFASFDLIVSYLYDPDGIRSEEHTSELQSQSNLVCRLLLEKKKKMNITTPRSRTMQDNSTTPSTSTT